MSDLGPVVVRHTVAAPQTQVWQMLIDDAARASWWPDLQITPEVGGEVVNDDLSGAVDVVVNDLTLGFRWRRADDESDRTVVVMLRPEDDDFDLTRMTVIESGFAVLPDAKEVVFASTSAWEERFNALKFAVTPESGEPADDEAVAAVDADEDSTESAHDVDAAVETDVPGEIDASEHSEAADHDESQVHDDSHAHDDTEVAEAADVTGSTDEVDDANPAEEAEDEAGATADDSEVNADDIEDADIDMSDIDVSEGEEVGVFTAEVSTDSGDHNIIEIVTEEIIDAETIEETDGIFLPEVSGAPFTESIVQITSDLGVDEPVDVDETSEWERLLRGEDLDDRH